MKWVFQNNTQWKQKMNVKGKYATIFHNDKDGKQWYTLSDSSKNVDGTYTNYPWTIKFKKGEPIPQHKSKIKYDGFMNYYAKDEKTKYVSIQCTNWEYMDGATERESQQVKDTFNPYETQRDDSHIPVVDDDILPF